MLTAPNSTNVEINSIQFNYLSLLKKETKEADPLP